MDEKIKILVCGDVKGKFKTFFSKLETLNKKVGPFELVFVVGEFFGTSEDELNQLNKLNKTSIPIYILGPTSADHEKFYSDINGCEIAPNVSYLGKRGLFVPSSGLKIAYLSGLQSASDSESENCTFNKKDAMALKAACIRNQSSFRGIDLFLTNQWPKYITDLDNSFKGQYSDSDIVTWLATQLKPRYHFARHDQNYFERKPYRNKNKLNSMEIASRFIALAPIDNPAKQKWIYALNLTPVDRMRMTELCQKTTDETDSPFPEEYLREDITTDIAKGQQKHGVQYFYDMNAQEDDDRRNKRKGDHRQNREKRPRPEFDQMKCWFCLGSPNVEKHLVISIGNESYLALAKGGLVSEHVLILPIMHYQATVGAPEACLEEIDKFKSALKKYFDEKDEVPVFFERNYKTSHLQIQVIPIPKRAQRELKEIFIDEANGHGFELNELDSSKSIQEIFPKGTPYFVVELPGGQILYTRIKSNFPLQFGREVLASGPILDLPDRIEWQDCKLNETEESALTQQFRKRFEPFDFTT